MILGIIGTGLIGGSIGKRARQLGWHVIGFDALEGTAEEAAACGAIDEVSTREAIDVRADVIVVATHISGTLAELERMRAQRVRKAALIIDVSSVKAAIVPASRGVRNFVATHPMAGREVSGPAGATRDLFEGKMWPYVPAGDRELDGRAAAFIGSLGAIPVAVDAEEHDRIVARTSHVPQIVATLFSARVSARDEQFCGPVATSLLRLRRSSREMWSEILDANRKQICDELRQLAGAMLETAAELENGENLYRQAVGR